MTPAERRALLDIKNHLTVIEVQLKAALRLAQEGQREHDDMMSMAFQCKAAQAEVENKLKRK